MLGRVILVAVALIPPALVVREVVRFATPIPFWDQWDFIPLLLDTECGRWRWDLLWAQSNEHRLLVPRLLWLAMALPTRWDIRWELAANLVLALGIVGLLTLLAHRTLRSTASWATAAIGLAASALTFSIASYENWFWGWQLQIFLTVLVVAWIAERLACWKGTQRGILPILGAALIAPFTFATGLPLLVLVPATLLLCGVGPARSRRALMVAGCTGVVAALYLQGFVHPPSHSSPRLVLERPKDYAAYVLTYIGGPLGRHNAGASLRWGITGLVLLTATTGWLWWNVP